MLRGLTSANRYPQCCILPFSARFVCVDTFRRYSAWVSLLVTRFTGQFSCFPWPRWRPKLVHVFSNLAQGHISYVYMLLYIYICVCVCVHAACMFNVKQKQHSPCATPSSNRRPDVPPARLDPLRSSNGSHGLRIACEHHPQH